MGIEFPVPLYMRVTFKGLRLPAHVTLTHSNVSIARLDSTRRVLLSHLPTYGNRQCYVVRTTHGEGSVSAFLSPIL